MTYNDQDDSRNECPLGRAEKPEKGFNANIPSHLLSKLTPEERWLFTTISSVQQEQSWLSDVVIRQNEVIRMLWARQAKQNLWVTIFSAKWGIFTWIFGLGITAAVIEAVKMLFRFFGGTHP